MLERCYRQFQCWGGRNNLAAWGLDRTFYQLLKNRGKKLEILQMPLPAKTFRGTLPGGKNFAKKFHQLWELRLLKTL